MFDKWKYALIIAKKNKPTVKHVTQAILEAGGTYGPPAKSKDGYMMAIFDGGIQVDVVYLGNLQTDLSEIIEL